jgi:hypothetical protein|nr:MAG TPA: protein of unknown function (DUF4355) [Caudoviricetes sp.]
MSEFKIIETQEQLDEIIKNRIERVKAKYADYDSLSAKVQDLETEKLKLTELLDKQKEIEGNDKNKIAELEKNVQGWETKALKQKVAIKYNLPFDLADRLKGDSEESLTEDAERLASLMVGNQPTYKQPLADVERPVKSGVSAAWQDVVNNLK